MRTWTPVWSSIVDSSIWLEDDCVCKVFITMLALKDADHVVRYDAFQLAQRAHKTEDEVLAALKILSAPDRRRKEKQAYDGRRIEKVADGWLMLNGEKYRKMMSQMYRKAYKAAKQAEYRGRAKGGRVSQEFMEREARYVEAHNNGDETRAAQIAAEGLPAGE